VRDICFSDPFGIDFPSFEEGRPRRFKNVSLPQEIGAAGEVRQIPHLAEYV
jgi:hypothetical protein